MRYLGDTCAIRNCVFIGGKSASDALGGALCVMDGYDGFTVENCIFAGNQSVNGGGALYLDWTGVTFKNCLVTGNKAAGPGGALTTDIYFSNVNAEMLNCTFADNITTGQGAIQTHGGTASNLTLVNCIVANNTQTSASLFQTQSGELTRDNCLLFGNNEAGATGTLLRPDVTEDPTFKGVVATGTVASVTSNSSGTITVIGLEGTPFVGINVGGVLVNESLAVTE